MNFFTVEALKSMTATQKRFILSMRSIPEHLEGFALKEYVVEMFPPAHLFCKKIFDMPSMWTKLRGYLHSKDGQQQHSSRRLILKFAYELSTEAKERDAAIQSANLILSHGHKVRKDLNPIERCSLGATFGVTALPNKTFNTNVLRRKALWQMLL